MQKNCFEHQNNSCSFTSYKYSTKYFCYIHSKFAPRNKTFSSSIIFNVTVYLYYLVHYTDNACAK